MAEDEDRPLEGAISGTLTERGHVLLQRVYFEDTDFSGRVYHARYLHFFERGRSDYLRLLGVHHRALAAAGQAFAVAHMDIRFLRPATIDDVVEIETVPEQVAGARIVLAQEMSRAGEALARARVSVVLVGAGGKPLRLPPSVRDLLAPGRYPAREKP